MAPLKLSDWEKISMPAFNAAIHGNLRQFDPCKGGQRPKSLINHKFSQLQPIGLLGRLNDQTLWLCLCDCGGIWVAAAAHLKNGDAKSCERCWATHRSRAHETHGQHRSRAYESWHQIIQRCHNPKNKKFKDYGSRPDNPILVCDRWRDSFENFFADMGDRPKGLSIERIDNDKGYFKDNCVWADWFTQANNKRNSKRLTANGETHTVSQWVRIRGIPHETIRSRVLRGLSHEKALGFKELNS